MSWTCPKCKTELDLGLVAAIRKPKPVKPALPPPPPPGVEEVVSPPRLLLSVVEVAELLAVGRNRVFELIASGELKSVKIGKSRRVPNAAVVADVESLTSSALADR